MGQPEDQIQGDSSLTCTGRLYRQVTVCMCGHQPRGHHDVSVNISVMQSPRLSSVLSTHTIDANLVLHASIIHAAECSQFVLNVPQY